MKEKCFIKTKDEETANRLIQEGFVLLEKSNGVWTFLNEQRKDQNMQKQNLAYSNILTF